MASAIRRSADRSETLRHLAQRNESVSRRSLLVHANRALNALNFGQQSKPQLVANDFGVSAGGPLWPLQPLPMAP
jgi:hypothetical protein